MSQKVTAKKSSGQPASKLQAAYLSSASTSQLLDRLLEVHQILDEAQSPFPLDKSFVEELLKKEYVNSSNVDVQAVLGSIIADVLRLGSATQQLPFPVSRASAVLQFFATVLERVRTHKKPSTALLMQARHTIERLALSHAASRLMSSSSTDDAEDALSGLLQTFLNDFTAADEDMSVLSRISIVLGDCISAHQALTEAQLGLILGAIAVSKKQSNPVGAAIAVAVLRRHEEHLSAIVANHLSHQYESGSEELKRVEITSGDATERRTALKQISGALEAAIELSRVGPGMVAQLIPQLQQGLTTDHGDIRLITIRGFCKVFAVSTEIVRSYPHAYSLLLSRFTDPKPIIRQELVKFAQQSILLSPTESNWQILGSHLEGKLVDSDEGVRRNSITVLCELAAASTTAVPKHLLEAVGQRCADKHVKVRTHATEKLMQLYRGLPHYSWIPDAVFLSIHGEGGVVAIELGLEDMLPSATKVANAMESAQKTRKSKAKDLAIFDFELEGQGGDAADADVSDDALRAAAKNSSFMDAFCKLCGDLSDTNLSILLKLMEKKRNLRQTVKRLFELRADIKRIGNIESPEGRAVSTNVVRLLTFLQSITHAKKGEWDAIFRAKDEKIAKAFLAAVDDKAQSDGQDAGVQLGVALQGRLSGDAITFVQQALVRRLFFPAGKAHADELAARLTQERSLPFAKRLGSMRAAACLLAAQPPLLAYLFPILVDTLSLEATRDGTLPDAPKSPRANTANKKDADKTAKLESESRNGLLLTLLSILAIPEIETVAGASAVKQLEQQSKTLIRSIGRMCIQTPQPRIAKAAAKVLCCLFPSHGGAFKQLLGAIREKIGHVIDGTESFVIQVASWLKTISTISSSPIATVSSSVSEEFMEEISQILFGAVRTCVQDEPLDAKSKKVDDLLTFPAPTATIVDACAKLITRFATQQPAAKASILITKAIDDLVAAYRETRLLGSGTVGACKKRMAIAKQLLRIAAQPGSPLDVSRSISIAVITSAEDNAIVRHVLQRKIQHHIHKQKSDVRMFAVLLLTALSEENRSGYQQLRTVVHVVGDKMRQLQAKDEVTLDQEKALWCYPEYAIPTLVHILAHHSFADSERESGFMGYQRVWHLLFDELFRNGTNCASFCSEMLRKLKSLDDSLDPDSAKTRIMCDLASKIMIECLGQRSVRPEALKPYPGAVLLPKMFVAPLDPKRFPADVVYLDRAVTISAHPPFKVPLFGATPAKSLGAASESVPPADDEESQLSPRKLLDTADNEEIVMSTTRSTGKAGPASPTPKSATPRPSKRPREEASEDKEDEEARDQRIIHDFISKFCKSVTAKQFAEQGWKGLIRKLEEAVNKKLSEELKHYATNLLKELQPTA